MEKPLYGNHSLRNLTLQKRILRMCANHGMSNVRKLPLRKRINKQKTQDEMPMIKTYTIQGVQLYMYHYSFGL